MTLKETAQQLINASLDARFEKVRARMAALQNSEKIRVEELMEVAALQAAAMAALSEELYNSTTEFKDILAEARNDSASQASTESIKINKTLKDLETMIRNSLSTIRTTRRPLWPVILIMLTLNPLIATISIASWTWLHPSSTAGNEAVMRYGEIVTNWLINASPEQQNAMEKLLQTKPGASPTQ